ncbi:MAG: ribonuclease J [Mycoplasmatales bacterium]
MNNEQIKRTNFSSNISNRNFNKPRPGHRSENSLKLMALGGMGEVGKNCYVVEYKRDLFVIDYGVLFPGSEYVGVDYIIPNFTYLKQNERRIKGLYITHAHEDHIGGIPFLLKKVKIPVIYASKITKLLIEKKLKEHKLTANIIEINEYTTLKEKDVLIHTFRQTHSVPNCLGLFFETPIGNVATTGDFKVDFSPSGEKRIDFQRITDLSKKKVLCLMSDSTNSLREGFSESSAEIGENLKLLIKEAQGRILFTTFASHINRVQKIVEGCLETNRKVCVLGRSMKNNLQIGMKIGYIKLKPNDIIDLKEIKNYAPNEVCIICTGSQGETLAALSRIAHGLNANFSLSSDDTVVFASSPIPGNNYQIGKVIDQLAKTECKIITNSSYFKTHTSGHASKEEQKLMLSLFEPEYFLPIHGNYYMLLEHKKTWTTMGFTKTNSFLFDNGDVLTFKKGQRPTIKRKAFPGQSMFVSGNNVNVSLEQSSMNQLATDGMLVVSLLVGRNKKLISYPQITTRGFIIINERIDLLKQIQKYLIKVYNDNQELKEEELIILLKKRMMQYIYNKTGKNPFVSINTIKYNPQRKSKETKI